MKFNIPKDEEKHLNGKNISNPSQAKRRLLNKQKELPKIIEDFFEYAHKLAIFNRKVIDQKVNYAFERSLKSASFISFFNNLEQNEQKEIILDLIRTSNYPNTILNFIEETKIKIMSESKTLNDSLEDQRNFTGLLKRLNQIKKVNGLNFGELLKLGDFIFNKYGVGITDSELKNAINEYLNSNEFRSIRKMNENVDWLKKKILKKPSLSRQIKEWLIAGNIQPDFCRDLKLEKNSIVKKMQIKLKNSKGWEYVITDEGRICLEKAIN